MTTNNNSKKPFIDFLNKYKQMSNMNVFDYINVYNTINANYVNNNYNNPYYSGITINKPIKYNKYNPPTKWINWQPCSDPNCPIPECISNQQMQQPHPPPVPLPPPPLQQQYYQMYNNSQWNTSVQQPQILNQINMELPTQRNLSNRFTQLSISNPQSDSPTAPKGGVLNEKKRNELNKLIVDNKRYNDKQDRQDKQKEEVIIKKINKVDIDVSILKLEDLINIINTYEYKEDTEYNIDLKSLHNIKDELVQLNCMIGLTNFKQMILDQLLYFIQNLHIGIGTDQDFKHTVICGPPGTGKTEIAKIIGKMYSKIGILKNNIFKKVCRSDLIAGYLGQTAIKTKKVITECLGGCLFIDEAYSLACSDGNDSFSKECIDTLCEALSDHKDDLMVIVAGYEEDMKELFFPSNRGLSSRFIWRFKVDDYSAKELLTIFQKKIIDIGWTFDFDQPSTPNKEVKEPEKKENTAVVRKLSQPTLVKPVIEKWFDERVKEFIHFGRDMELLLTYTKIVHGRRIYGKSPDLRKKITLDDLNEGYKVFLKNTKVKKEQREIRGLYI